VPIVDASRQDAQAIWETISQMNYSHFGGPGSVLPLHLTAACQASQNGFRNRETVSQWNLAADRDTGIAAWK
jgi:hypothetical protein